MEAPHSLGYVEFAVLDALHRGTLRSRPCARKVGILREYPAREAILHEALRLLQRDGLVCSTRESSGRRYEVTAAGRARLRADRRSRAVLMRMLTGSREVRDAAPNPPPGSTTPRPRSAVTYA